MKKILRKEHGGFAITLEVMATLFMICVFMVFTLYFTRVMNVQRYMNTVMVSTAAQASRWGGGNTNAYKANVSSSKTLEQIAQEQLNVVANYQGGYGAVINITPDKILNNGDKITVTVTYHLPEVFSTMSEVNSLNNHYDMSEKVKNMKMQISVNSIMEAGELL